LHLIATKRTTCYFITGSDESAVKKAAVALAAELAPGADAFGLETIDGAVETVEGVEGVRAYVQNGVEFRCAVLSCPVRKTEHGPRQHSRRFD